MFSRRTQRVAQVFGDLLEDLVEPVQPAPDHKGPVGAVPQPADQESGHDIQAGPQQARLCCAGAGN